MTNFPVTREGMFVAATDILTHVAVGLVTGSWDVVLLTLLPQFIIGIAWQATNTLYPREESENNDAV